MASFISVPIICYQPVHFQINQYRNHCLQNGFCQAYQFEIPRQKNIFLFKKKKNEKEVFQLYLAHTKFVFSSTSV